jgi:hypothetical protein
VTFTRSDISTNCITDLRSLALRPEAERAYEYLCCGGARLSGDVGAVATWVQLEKAEEYTRQVNSHHAQPALLTKDWKEIKEIYQ